jgi:hypothetical protein
MIRALAAALVLIVASFASREVANAQTSIQVRSNTAQSGFPNGISFQLDATAGGRFDEIRIVYQIAPDGVRATAVPQCTTGTAVTCSYQLAGSQQDIIIPGAEVTYFWRLTSGGAMQETAPQKVVYDDSRFKWKTITERNMTIWYYSGSDDQARAVLEAGLASEGSSSALLQTTIDFPVKLFYYATAEEMQPAILANNSAGVITLGEVVYSDTAMVAADASPKEIARHEIAHVVQRAALSGPYNAPDWLIEGMAVYEQSQPLGGQKQAIDSAIASGQVFSVRSMSSATSGALSGNVFLFYGESWSLVKFLIDTYGQQKFADLFRAIDAGAGTAGALQQVYGFNQDGLENAWRASVGLPSRQAPTPEDGALAPAPTNEVPNSPTTTTAHDGGSSKAVLIAVIIAATAVLAGGLLGAGVLLARRYR